MPQHDAELPVPFVVGVVPDRLDARHADDVDDAVDSTERLARLGEDFFDPAAGRHVGDAGPAGNGLGNGLGTVWIQVDAKNACAGLGERV
jgi:hypothetical protein